MTPACLARSGPNLTAVLAALDVENNPAWKRRDVTGDGLPETFCNQAVEAACKALECQLPPGFLASQQIEWLDSAAGRDKAWEECSAHRAAIRAELGYPVIVGIRLQPHAHIGMVVPAIGGDGLHVWAAGHTNFSNTPIEKSFGAESPKHPRRFFTHA